MALLRTITALICASVAFGAQPVSAEIVIPPEPSVRDIPRRNYQGDRIRGLALYTTSVTQFEDGEVVVMYGFIVGQMNGDSNYLMWNAPLNMSCYGRTERQTDGSGHGEYFCERDGTVILGDSFAVIAEKYGRMRGTVTATFAGRSGGTLNVGLQWQAREQFPEPRLMIEAVQ